MRVKEPNECQDGQQSESVTNHSTSQVKKLNIRFYIPDPAARTRKLETTNKRAYKILWFAAAEPPIELIVCLLLHFP